jgi:hypothetical protein
VSQLLRETLPAVVRGDMRTPAVQAALMAFLVFTPVLNRASRLAFNNLARFMASCRGAPARLHSLNVVHP